MNNDVIRTTFYEPMKDAPSNQLPTAFQSRFGSAHSTGLNVCLGDGSVRFIRYTIAITTFQPMGDIRSGAVFTLN
jgi:prepilin-type processing-associated H-X9-DG protein